MIELEIAKYLILSSFVFAIGMVGIFLNHDNIIRILLSIELMLLGININFITFSYYLNNISGQIFALMILTVAAAETSIGLAIILIHFKNKGSISIQDMNHLKG